MAKTTPTDDAPRKRKTPSTVVWIVLGLLVLSLGGFGVTSFGGGTASVARVGEREITVQQYFRALRNQINALSAQFGTRLPFEQAQALGLDRQVISQLISDAAISGEADRIGISAGDARIAAQLMAMSDFTDASGEFSRQTYRDTLENNDLTESEFETGLRDDMSRAILQGAVAGGFTGPSVLTDTLYTYVAERRAITLLRLTEADLPSPLPDPTEAELTAYYNENIAQFTLSEAKRITYAALLPEALAATMTVDEAELQKLYDDRIAEFVQPERRLVERLVYPTEADAQAAKARLDAGETFETLVAARNLTLDDIDMGDVSKTDLGPAGDAVFALTGPGVAGPLPSDLGPALFRMNAILSAQEVTFDEARPDLLIEYQQDAARRAIADKVEQIDDLLAGGMTLEDLAKETGMTLETLDFRPGTDAPIAGYPAFREAAGAAAEGDFPEAVILDDGGVVALRLDQIVPAAAIPFAEARADVAAAWRASALAVALAARAAEIRTAVEGGANIGSYGILSVSPELSRDGQVEGTPESFIETVFGMAEGELQVIEGAGFTGLVRLDAIKPAEQSGEEAEALKAAIAAQGQRGLQQDAFALFSAAIAAGAGVTRDEGAINSVHSSFIDRQ